MEAGDSHNGPHDGRGQLDSTVRGVSMLRLDAFLRSCSTASSFFRKYLVGSSFIS